MIARWLGGGALSATALVLWSWLFWSLSPAVSLVQPVPSHEQFLSGTIETVIDHAGAYRLPTQQPGEDDEAFASRLAAVPVVLMFANRDGREPDIVTEVGFRWVVFFVAGLVSMALVRQLGAGGWSTRESVTRFGTIGLLGAIVINLSFPVLFWTPWTFFAVRLLYDTAAIMIAMMISRASMRFESGSIR